MPKVQRVRQLFGAVTARISPGEEAIPDNYLTAALRKLFFAMPVNDQRHALNVFYQLRAAGHENTDLLQAALLHDVGKSRAKAGLFTRVAMVLLPRIDRRLIDRLGKEHSEGWRGTFFVYPRHAQIGAELVHRTGASSELVRLIREHGSPPADSLARALHEADEEN